MQINSFYQQMSDGYNIWVNRWSPDNDAEIKGIVQLHHGLAEHSMRYDRLGSILAENGFVLNAYDFRGHGKSAEKAEAEGYGLFGKLADKDGFNRVVEDLNEAITKVKADYPDKKIVLLGHSFGSFVSQGYLEKYGSNIDACTLCGTAGPRNLMVRAGKIAVDLVNAFQGGNKCSKFLSNTAFGGYNKRVQNPTSPNDWISANQDNIKLYNEDKWCGFPLTNSFFHDMMCGLKQIHKSSNMKKVPKNLPINFIYGAEDPVGDYGKTIEKLYNIYKKNGVSNLEIKAYAGDRHELFNEADKETVEKDLINWIEKNL